MTLAPGAAIRADPTGTLAVGGNGLATVPASGGFPTPVPGAILFDAFPAWSPDGSLIAFTRAQPVTDDIYLIRPDGSGLRRLTFNPGEDTRPSWSPTGKSIAFASDRHRDGVYVLNLRNGQARFVADGYEPEWTTDNRILFIDEQLRVASVRPYGADRRLLSVARGSGVTSLALSPDGRQLAYVTSNGDMRIARLGGRKVQVLVPSPLRAGIDLGRPSWSPDGEWIAYDRVGDATREVDLIRPDGSDPRRLLSDWTEPDWLPLGP